MSLDYHKKCASYTLCLLYFLSFLTHRTMLQLWSSLWGCVINSVLPPRCLPFPHTSHLAWRTCRYRMSCWDGNGLAGPWSLESETYILNVSIMLLLLIALLHWACHMPFSLNDELLQGEFIHPSWVLEDQTTLGDKITNTLLEGWKYSGIGWEIEHVHRAATCQRVEGGIVPESIGNNNWAMMRCISYRKHEN